MMKYAIFDLDHTLLPIDSGDAWTRFIIDATGAEQKATLLEQAEAINQGYRAGAFDPEAAVAFQMSLLTRTDRARLLQLREQFLTSVVWPAITPAALNLVADRRNAGFTLIMASGTHQFVTAPIAQRFGISILLAAKPEQDAQGLFTGRLVGSHSYREGKLTLLKSFLCEQPHAVPYLLEAYSDSINDLPLLEFVEAQGGRAVAVNADKRLANLAIERGWERLDLYEKEHISPC